MKETSCHSPLAPQTPHRDRSSFVADKASSICSSPSRCRFRRRTGSFWSQHGVLRRRKGLCGWSGDAVLESNGGEEVCAATRHKPRPLKEVLMPALGRFSSAPSAASSLSFVPLAASPGPSVPVRRFHPTRQTFSDRPFSCATVKTSNARRVRVPPRMRTPLHFAGGGAVAARS